MKTEEELRDEFAGKAMAELMARWGSCDPVTHKSIAERAYQMADAMMEARKGGEK